MRVSISRQLLESMLEVAHELHPREVVLLLRGKVGRGGIFIEEFLFPPFATTSSAYAQFPLHMLPIDFSIVGTAHSHPSGVLAPSAADLNHFYSRVMMIFAYPYGERDVGAFNSRGETVPINVLG